MCDIGPGIILERTAPYAVNLPFNIEVLKHEEGGVLRVRSLFDTTAVSENGVKEGEEFRIPCDFKGMYHVPPTPAIS